MRLNRIELSFYYEDCSYNINNADYLNKWTYLTFVYDHANLTQKIYVNGVLVSSRTTTAANGIIATSQAYAIGRAGIGISANTGYFAGRLDDFRIYNSIVLTDSQITELYKGRISFIISSQSGGSGGGGSSYLSQSGAIAGIPFNSTYSKLNSGFNGTSTQGGNGGSSSSFLGIPVRYIETITGTNLELGLGGTGGTS